MFFVDPRYNNKTISKFEIKVTSQWGSHEHVRKVYSNSVFING